MRIIILTSNRKGTASYCLSILVEKAAVDIARVIYCENVTRSRRRLYLQKIRKIFKIGLLGALNGIRIRKWFVVTEVDDRPIEDIQVLCKRYNVPFSISQGINTAATMELIRSSDADLGLSLGNSYIARKVFNLPRLGMLNIHGEVLPEFQNAQSVIWQLYEGHAETGYTIHQVEPKIDGGVIWKQEKFPILFKDDFGRTVSATCAEILKRAAWGLADLLNHFEEYGKKIQEQAEGRSYTTPSFRAFLRMRRNYKRLRRLSRNPSC
jgi:methionyl-tRNA formyltransferase